MELEGEHMRPIKQPAMEMARDLVFGQTKWSLCEHLFLSAAVAHHPLPLLKGKALRD